MPWKAMSNKVYKKENGRWKVKQVCKSNLNAKKAVRLLYMKYGEDPK